MISINGCSKDYFDVNTPSGTADLEQLSMRDLLGPVIYHTVYAEYYTERTLGNYAQQFTGRSGGAAGKASLSGTWSEIYLRVLPNLKEIQKKAEEKNAIHYNAVAEILTAMNIGLATDNWDFIPYSEATQGSSNMRPAFDSQEAVYNAIDALLTDAISKLESVDNSGFTLSNDDIVYHGDMAKWLKAAYTLKARYQLHLLPVNGNSSATDALANLANGFDSNADDFQISFDEKNMNPWYQREILAAATSNDHDKVGDQLVNYMNGTSYPFVGGVVTEDPRLSVYAERTVAADPWRGYLSGGDGLSSDGNDGNTNFKDGGFYTNMTAPIVLISYAEAEFMKAEAAFILNGGNATSVGGNADAYLAYTNGISASMNKLGVDGTDYLADGAINVGVAALKLEHIMKEKYIANFLNPETFVDMRRYDFSTDVYKDLSLPEDNAASEYPGEWLVRAVYPSSEESRNPDNVNAHKQEPTMPVWWDQ